MSNTDLLTIAILVFIIIVLSIPIIILYIQNLKVQVGDSTSVKIFYFLLKSQLKREPTPDEVRTAMDDFLLITIPSTLCPPHEWQKSADGSFKCSKCQQSTSQDE